MVSHDKKSIDFYIMPVTYLTDASFNKVLLLEFAKHIVAILCRKFDVPEICANFMAVMF